MTEAAKLSGAEINFDTEVADISYPEGKLIKNVKAIKPMMDADVLITTPRKHGRPTQRLPLAANATEIPWPR